MKHRLGAPASRKHLAWLRSALGGYSPELLEFYARSDGARLFVDSRDKNTYFQFIPIANMRAQHYQVDKWLRKNVINVEHDATGAIDDDGRLRIDGVPKWWESCVVFGAENRAADRMYLATEGRYAGQVFAFQHDESVSVRIAFSVNELFHRIHADPVGFTRSAFGGACFEIESYSDKADAAS